MLVQFYTYTKNKQKVGALMTMGPGAFALSAPRQGRLCPLPLPLPLQTSDGIYIFPGEPLHMSLRDDLKVFQHLYHLNPKDSENLRMSGTTLIRLAHIPARDADTAQVFSWLHDSISKLEEALEINEDDHEAMSLLGTAHYMLFTWSDDQTYSDFYVEHCRKAYGCFKYLKEKAPKVYEQDPGVLDRIRNWLPQGMLDSDLDYKSYTETMNTIDPAFDLYPDEWNQKKEEEMIQEAVETLLLALPYDDNSELVEKLAEFSRRHKKNTTSVAFEDTNSKADMPFPQL